MHLHSPGSGSPCSGCAKKDVPGGPTRHPGCTRTAAPIPPPCPPLLHRAHLPRCAYLPRVHTGFEIPHHYFNAEKPRKGGAAIHDYEGEFKRIVLLAKAGLVEMAEPCAAGCEAESGVPCTSCAPGGTCQCGTGMPLPVAMPHRACAFRTLHLLQCR